MKRELDFKTVDPSDFDFMKEMLYEAVYWRSLKTGYAPDFEEGLKADGVMNSIIDWGEGKQDLGLIVFQGTTPLGAVWIRQYNKSNSIRGFIDESIPVLVIGIRMESRGLGIGKALMKKLFQAAKSEGCKSISLMVSEDNEAFYLYKKTGFEIVSKEDDSYLMIKHL